MPDFLDRGVYLLSGVRHQSFRNDAGQPDRHIIGSIATGGNAQLPYIRVADIQRFQL